MALGAASVRKARPMLDTDQVSSVDLLQDTAEPLSQHSGVFGKTYLSKGINTVRGETQR